MSAAVARITVPPPPYDFAVIACPFSSTDVLVKVTSQAARDALDGAVMCNVRKSMLAGWVSRMKKRGFVVFVDSGA